MPLTLLMMGRPLRRVIVFTRSLLQVNVCHFVALLDHDADFADEFEKERALQVVAIAIVLSP